MEVLFDDQPGMDNLGPWAGWVGWGGSAEEEEEGGDSRTQKIIKYSNGVNKL